MIADMADAIALLGEGGTYTVKPGASVAYVGGRPVASAAPAPVQVQAVVMPASGRDVERLPEGAREAETVQVFTPYALRGLEDGRAGDVLVADGREYEVQTVERWDALGGYVRALAVLKG